MDPALVVARALHFWAVATLFGGAGLALALRRRQHVVILTLRVAAAIAAASGVAWFATVFLDVTGAVTGFVDRDMWNAFLGAPFGLPWLARLVLCLVAAGLAVRCERLPFLVLGACLVIDQAWLGHAATGVGYETLVQLLFYWMHVLAGFTWVGALVMLCVVAVEEKRVPRDGLALFSGLGPLVVAAIVASGVVNASLRGVGFADLWTTSYGKVLSLKLILFAAMVVLAVHNRRRPYRPDGADSLGRTIVTETLFGFGVLAVAALLGVTAPQ